MLRATLPTTILIAALAACPAPQAPSQDVPTGDEGGPCYPNSTCNDGLTCLSSLCVAAGAGEGEGEGEITALPGILANVTPLLAAEECPAGGVDVSTGIDRNANGELEVDEVTRVVTICNGENGASAIADTEPFESSAGCPAGGIAVNAGIDLDGDSQLSAGEILRTDELCNGAAGANGLTTRIVLSTVAEGAVCAAGGVTIESGLDANGDGALAAGEVQQRATVCNGVPGEQGPPGTSCTVDRNDTLGTTTITCEDGTEAVVHDGEAGATGLQTLVRLEPELGGPRCPFSGTRILIGVDENRNGVLEGAGSGDGEVDDESVVCGTALAECAAGFSRASADGPCLQGNPSITDGILLSVLCDGAIVDTGPNQFAVSVSGVSLVADRHGQVSSACRVAAGGGISATTSFLLGSATPFSLSAWVKPEQLPLSGQYPLFVAMNHGVCNGFGSGLLMNGDRRGNAAAEIGQSCVSSDTTSSPITTDRWTHIAMTYDGLDVRLYMNGQNVGLVRYSSASVPPAAAKLAVGRGSGGEPHTFYQGSIDDLKIFTRAITPSEVFLISSQ